MTVRQIKKLLARAQAEIDKECIVNSDKALYQRFELACREFKNKLAKQEDKNKAIDKIIEIYTECFFDLAYCYYAVGYRKGFLSTARDSILSE